MNRARLELTPRGRVTLLLVHLTASAAYLTSQTFAQLATAALAAPFLVDLAWKLLARPRVSVSVGPRRTRAGDLYLESLRVENRSARSAAHALELAEPATGVRHGDAWIETMPAASSVRVDLPARARRRGIAEERAFAITSSHPFGMLQWRIAVTYPARIVSEPARVALPPEILAKLDDAEREPRATGARAGAEFFALREYRVGDDARLVHARRSASVGVLVARDARGGRESEGTIFVDLRRPPGRGYHFGDSQLEVRLGLAARLLDELITRGAAPACVLLDGGLRTWRIEGRHDAESFLDALAVARAVPYRRVDPHAIEDAAIAGRAFWIPAGGYDAVQDRARLDRAVVVDRESAA